MSANAPPQLDHYRLLDVAPGATPREITRAYREAMKRTHPDRVGPAFRLKAEERAKEINAAYRVLSNPASRQSYDATIRDSSVQDQLMSRYAGGFGAPGSGGIDPYGASLRRERSTVERQEIRRTDRQALVGILVVFGGATALVVVLLVALALLEALARAVS